MVTFDVFWIVCQFDGCYTGRDSFQRASLFSQQTSCAQSYPKLFFDQSAQFMFLFCGAVQNASWNSLRHLHVEFLKKLLLTHEFLKKRFSSFFNPPFSSLSKDNLPTWLAISCWHILMIFSDFMLFLIVRLIRGVHIYIYICFFARIT